MSRQHQLEGVYQRWGGTPGTLATNPVTSGPFASWLKTIIQGEPLNLLEFETPAIYLLAPESHETRQAAQMKWITYPLEAVVAWQTPGVQGSAEGASVIVQFYQYLDSIAANIRGSTDDPSAKILTTQADPHGQWPDGTTSIKFGEQFSIHEEHNRLENLMNIVAHIQIQSVEQVLA